MCDKAEGYAGRNISNDFTRGLNGWTVINEQGTQIWELIAIVHFTVVCLVAKPLDRSEAKGDLVMIQTLLLLKCKLICYHAN